MAKILLLAVLCVLSATLITSEFNKEEAMKKFLAVSEECRAETGATPSDIDEMFKKIPASTKEGKCARACLMKKYDVMDNNGKFVPEIARKHVEEITGGDEAKMKIGRAIHEGCSSISVPDDHCEAAEAYVKCFIEHAKAQGVEKFDF